MSNEQKANTGLGHDSAGHVDDKRVVMWLAFAVAVALAFAAVVLKSEEAAELYRPTLWAALALGGVTTFEGFRSGSGR